jgi:hypothetical protein
MPGAFGYQREFDFRMVMKRTIEAAGMKLEQRKRVNLVMRDLFQHGFHDII